jgi:hypothetical protein
MPWTIPDFGEGDNNIQSILFQEYLDVLVAGLSATDCVLSGLEVTGGADMTPAVAKGAVLSNRIMYAVAGADVTIPTADATNPRLDLIVVTSAGALAVRQGTAAAAPRPPNRTANDVVIAVVYVPANDTAIATSQITDLRVTPPFPVVIYNQSAADTDNNTSAAIHIINGAASGLTIPDGLLLTGRRLRVRAGGNWLANSGTPTIRVIIAYGGTTMFNDLSGATTGDTDRSAWFADFEIVAQGTSDQALVGTLAMGQIAAKTAPTTGTGDAWSTAMNIAPVSGAAAVNSDTANRVLEMTFTFSVANAANELVTESVVVELL